MYINNPNDTYFYKDVITFSCTEGYEFQDGHSSTCQASSQWSQPFPVCESNNIGIRAAF